MNIFRAAFLKLMGDRHEILSSNNGCIATGLIIFFSENGPLSSSFSNGMYKYTETGDAFVYKIFTIKARTTWYLFRWEKKNKQGLYFMKQEFYGLYLWCHCHCRLQGFYSKIKIIFTLLSDQGKHYLSEKGVVFYFLLLYL